MFQFENFFERDPLTDVSQNRFDVLYRKDTCEYLTFESGTRRAHKSRAVAQSDVLVPVDRLESFRFTGSSTRSYDLATE